MPASAMTSAGAGDRHGGGENLRAVGIRGPHGEQAIFLGAHGAAGFGDGLHGVSRGAVAQRR